MISYTNFSSVPQFLLYTGYFQLQNLINFSFFKDFLPLNNLFYCNFSVFEQFYEFSVKLLVIAKLKR